MVPPLVHPIVPFVNVPGTSTLEITSGGIWFCSVVPQGCLTVFGGVADVRSVFVTITLGLPPSWLVTRCWVVGVRWAAD